MWSRSITQNTTTAKISILGIDAIIARKRLLETSSDWPAVRRSVHCHYVAMFTHSVRISPTLPATVSAMYFLTLVALLVVIERTTMSGVSQNCLDELIWPQGLGHVIIHLSGKALFAITDHGVRCQCDDGR